MYFCRTSIGNSLMCSTADCRGRTVFAAVFAARIRRCLGPYCPELSARLGRCGVSDRRSWELHQPKAELSLADLRIAAGLQPAQPAVVRPVQERPATVLRFAVRRLPSPALAPVAAASAKRPPFPFLAQSPPHSVVISEYWPGRRHQPALSEMPRAGRRQRPSPRRELNTSVGYSHPPS